MVDIDFNGDPNQFTPVGDHTQTSSLASATPITIPAGATKVIMQTQTKDVRFTLDGTTPTTTKGFLLVANDPPFIVHLDTSHNTLTVIETATTAVFDYQFGR